MLLLSGRAPEAEQSAVAVCEFAVAEIVADNYRAGKQKQCPYYNPVEQPHKLFLVKEGLEDVHINHNHGDVENELGYVLNIGKQENSPQRESRLPPTEPKLRRLRRRKEVPFFFLSEYTRQKPAV